MIGRIADLGAVTVVLPQTDKLKRPADQVMKECHALGADPPGIGGKQQIVVHDGRAMAHLNKQVLAAKRGHNCLGILWGLVGIKQVPGNSCSLGLPVQPQAAGAVVDPIAHDLGINGGMELDARDLLPQDQLLDIDVMDVILFDPAEGRPQMPHNARLLTVVDTAVADSMVADAFLAPAQLPGGADRFALQLGAVLETSPAPAVFITRLHGLAQ